MSPKHSQDRPSYSELIDEKKAAKILDCAPSTLRKSRVTGVLFGKPAPPYVKRGRKVDYNVPTLHKFNAQFHEQENTAQ